MTTHPLPDGVIECRHCNATGVCAQSVRRQARGMSWQECSKCGQGLAARVNEGFRPPPCIVCNGTGHVRI